MPSVTPKNRKKIAMTCHGTELLRLSHAAMRSGVEAKVNAAESILSLLALQLAEEIVQIPTEMVPHYKVLTR